MRSGSSSRQLPVFAFVVLAVFLLARFSLFESFVEKLASWGWGVEPTADEVPMSVPDLDAPFEIVVGGQDDKGEDGQEGMVPADLAAALNPALPSLTPVSSPEGRASATEVIGRLRVEMRGPSGYDRSEFGDWSDDVDVLFGRNGCDTRNDILARDMNDVVLGDGTCVVESGTLAEPYTRAPLVFSRSNAPAAVQIDHIVSLSASWQMGAAHWDRETRVTFANDPLNLLATHGPVNAAKSDKTPKNWLPADESSRCAYAVRYAAVSLRYDLSVTERDHQAMVAQCS